MSAESDLVGGVGGGLEGGGGVLLPSAQPAEDPAADGVSTHVHGRPQVPAEIIPADTATVVVRRLVGGFGGAVPYLESATSTNWRAMSNRWQSSQTSAMISAGHA